jgi:hypothetical protein
MPRFITTAVIGIFSFGHPVTSGGTAAINIRPVISPWSTRPATNSPGTGAQAASTEPNVNRAAKPISSRCPFSRMVSCTATTVPRQ